MIKAAGSIPSYIKGRNKVFIRSFRIFEIGTSKIYSFLKDPSEQDSLAIFSDWQMVGEDLKSSMARFKQEADK